MANTGDSLFKMYTRGDGQTILAHRLQNIFSPIKTDEEAALHNDILSEVLLIIEGRERAFMNRLTDLILYKPILKQKRFLFRVAALILDIGHKKNN